MDLKQEMAAAEKSMLPKDEDTQDSNTSTDVESLVSREMWGNKFEAILSAVGFCVGLGNVWRFSYLCFVNGGGAFLIPYVIMIILCGLPMYFLEQLIGQYSSLSACTVWKLSPLFKGCGYVSLMNIIYCSIYYNILVAYILHFLVASMTTELPWATCDNEWNTPNCVDLGAPKNTSMVRNYTGFTESPNAVNTTFRNGFDVNHVSLPAKEYWERRVLEMTDDISDLGGIRWELVLYLIVAWVAVFLCIIKGIETSGKVVYFTALMPYVMLSILLVRGVTLPGAEKGLKFLLTPDFDRLLDPLVWGAAACQVFYSLGPTWAVIITFASHNKFNNNCEKDAIITCLIGPATSLFGGFVAFSIIGFVASELDVPVEKLMLSGPGLVFIVYPTALARLPVAPLWSVLFFIMLLCVAFDSQFAQVEAVATAIMDEIPKLRRYRISITALVCISMLLPGILLTTQAGIYFLTLLDSSIGSFPLLFVALFEIIAVIYVYGYNRLASNAFDMLGRRPSIYWRATWCVLTPVTIVFITIFVALTYSSLKLDNYVYPFWANCLSNGVIVSSILPIPIWFIIKFYQRSKLYGPVKSMKELKQIFGPEDGWGPMKFERQYINENIDSSVEVPLSDYKLDDSKYENIKDFHLNKI